MKTLSVAFLFFCLFLLPFTVSAEVKTFTHEVKQPFSGSQSPDDARVAATQKAKREVLEKAGTYLESLRIVERGRLKKDRVLALASGVLKTEIVSQKSYVTGEGFGIIIIAKVDVDTSGLEDRVKKLLKDKNHFEKYQASEQRVKELLAKVRVLEEQNRKPLSNEEKKELKKEFRGTSEKLAATKLNEKALALWNFGYYTDVDKAIGYLEQAILLDQQYGDAFGQLGSAYQSKGDYDKAIEYFQKALKINLKKLGPEHKTVAVLYNNLGAAYRHKRDYDKAIECYQKALKIDLKKLGPEHVSVAPLYNNLGVAYGKKGYSDKAIEYSQKALKIVLKKLGPGNARVATLYYNLGRAYQSKEDYDKAIEYCQEAVKIGLKKLGPEHPRVAVWYSGLGMAYNTKGDYDKAIECYQKALKIARKRLGSNHPHTKSIQNLLNSVK